MNALLFVCGLALLVFGAGRLFACTPALGRPSRMLQQVWVPLLVITVACGGVLVQEG